VGKTTLASQLRVLRPAIAVTGGWIDYFTDGEGFVNKKILGCDSRTPGAGILVILSPR
jgi:hypothetical protein